MIILSMIHLLQSVLKNDSFDYVSKMFQKSLWNRERTNVHLDANRLRDLPPENSEI